MIFLIEKYLADARGLALPQHHDGRGRLHDLIKQREREERITGQA